MLPENSNNVDEQPTPHIRPETESAISTKTSITQLIEECRGLISKRNYSKALEMLASTGDEYSNSIPVLGLQADCYKHLDDLDRAEDCFKNIITLETDTPFWVNVGYANVLERKGENSQALEFMLKGLSKQYSFSLAKRILKLALRQSSIWEVCAQIIDIVGKLEKPLRFSHLCTVGDYLVSAGEYAHGDTFYDEAVKICNDNISPVRRKIKSRLKLGSLRDALSLIDQWKKENPGDSRLDRFEKLSKDDNKLGSVDGLPSLTLEKNENIDGFRLFVNDFEINSGLSRFAKQRVVPVLSNLSTNTRKYIIHIPLEFLDSSESNYIVSVQSIDSKHLKLTRTYSRTDRKKIHRTYRGEFEYTGGSRIHGWYRNEFSCVSKEISLYLNGQHHRDIVCEVAREDIAGKYGPDWLRTGFDVSWPENIEVNTLELREKDTNSSVLDTPIKVCRMKSIIDAVEKSLSNRNVHFDSDLIGKEGVRAIFSSLRELPRVSIERSNENVPASRNLADGVSVIIPVFNSLLELKECLESLLRSSVPFGCEILLINDGSSDENIVKYLHDVSSKNESVFVVNSEINRGFVKTVNKGLLVRKYKHTIILNSDTLLPQKFVERLFNVFDSDRSFGVITPLSNNATIFSYPITLTENSLSGLPGLDVIDKFLEKESDQTMFPVPTAHGYCMFVSGDVIDEIGILDAEKWGVGYAEENDFCQKAKMSGWKIGAFYGMYVGHIGSSSFGVAKRESQISKNLEKLNQIYPEYSQVIQTHINSEGESRVFRNRLQVRYWFTRQKNSGLRSMLFVSHALGGGTAEYIKRCEIALAKEGIEVLILTNTEHGGFQLSDRGKTLICNYTPNEITELCSHVGLLNVMEMVFNSTFNFPPKMLDRLIEVGNSYTVVVHDYSWFCPRVNLIDAHGSYCGMPDRDVCVKCIKVAGTHKDISNEWKSDSGGLNEWLRHNEKFLDNARRVIAPSKDAARRISTKFPLTTPIVRYHSDGFALPVMMERFVDDGLGNQTIAIFGMIGDHKGLGVLKNLCWLLTSKHPGVEIVFFGAIANYDWLDGYDNVKCVGEYCENSLPDLIKEIKPTISLFLSVWPETYCYALTDSIRNGVYPIAYDIGAFPERISMHNYGSIIPLSYDSECVYKSIVDVIESTSFTDARISNIQPGISYANELVDYFQLEALEAPPQESDLTYAYSEES